MKIVVNAVWRYIKQIDRVLLVLTLLAASYGLLMVYSTNLYLQKSKPVFMQLIGILIGITGMVILSKIDYHVYSSIWKYLAAAGITLIVVTLILGTGTKARQDNVAWLILPGGMSVQPAEYVKLIFIVTFSVHIDIVKENIDRLINVVFLGIHGVI
ncbi:MAG TPA: FtsW/RodA/SpoVE family cell cycle protein, partial [Clostridia bacterium]|nr:FtsW/RodA/SpoVE family cell cycle protein [Clostridia bacterium]